GVDGDRFHEMLVPVNDAEASPQGSFPSMTRVPIPRGIEKWFAECDAVMRRGTVIAIDYMCRADELAERDWLRTYRAHARGTDPLDAPGTQDITADVVFEQLVAAAPGFRVVAHKSQADWLRDLGIDTLAGVGAQQWR